MTEEEHAVVLLDQIMTVCSRIDMYSDECLDTLRQRIKTVGFSSTLEDMLTRLINEIKWNGIST